MTTEIDRMVRLLEKTFDKQPWYGQSIMEVLDDIDPKIMEFRQGPTHIIVELVRHMVSWRTFVTRRLEGDNTFEVTPEFNFPQSGTWDEALAGLKKSQQELVEAIRKYPESRLSEMVPSKVHKYTYYTLIHGSIQHDVYQLGQIAMLKKTFK